MARGDTNVKQADDGMWEVWQELEDGEIVLLARYGREEDARAYEAAVRGGDR